MNGIDQNPMEVLGRIQALERQLGDVKNIQNEQGAALQSTIETVNQSPAPGHQNFVRNGDLDWNRNHYLYAADFAGGTGEDANVSEEAAHVYAHPKDTCIDTTGSITSGTPNLTIDTPDFVAGDAGVEITVYGAGTAGADLYTTILGAPGSTTTCTLAVNAATTVANVRVRFRLLELSEDSTDENADADLTTNTTLKTPAHTRYATTVSNPDYDKTNGLIRWSDADNMLTFPLPYNNIMPSKQYILTFLYKLANDIGTDSEVFVDFFAGLWDNTSGQRTFLEGQLPVISEIVGGTPGATSRDYLVVMYLSDGRTVGTQVLTVPNTAATITSTNYVFLSWPQPPGVVRSEVYRKTGATYERLGFPYPANSYYDRGTVNNTVVSFPTTDLERFIALTQVTEGTFVKASSANWRLGQLNIVVPDDYDTSKTTDRQWLCIGMKTGFSGTGDDHALLIDRVSLDDKMGVFTKCPLDFLAVRNVSTAATTGNQGTAGGGITPGGGEIIPPGSGGCPVFDELIDTDHGKIRAVDLVDKEHEYKIIDRNGIPTEYTAEIIQPQQIYTLIAGKYHLTASYNHPIFTDYSDINGKPLYRFAKNDIIYTKDGLVKVNSLVKHFKKKHTVKISLKGSEKGFWQNDIGVHNAKLDPFDTGPIT